MCLYMQDVNVDLQNGDRLVFLFFLNLKVRKNVCQFVQIVFMCLCNQILGLHETMRKPSSWQMKIWTSTSNECFVHNKKQQKKSTVNITWDKIWQVELSDVEKFTMWEQMRDTQACADFQRILFSQSLILVFKILLQKQYVEVKPYASFSCLAFVIAVHQGDYSNTLAIFGLAIFSKSFVDFSGSLLQFFVCSSLCSFIYKTC